MTTAEMASRLEFAAKCHDKQVEECLSDDSRTHDLLAQAMRAGASALRASEWLPIEGAPKDGGKTWVTGHGKYSQPFDFTSGECRAEIYFNRMLREWLDRQGHSFTPTHYRPLPSPPKEQE